MPVDITVLERDGRILAIRKLKKSLYRVQAVMTLLFSLLLAFMGGGFSLTPLYIPLESFLYFLIVMGLIFMVEAFILRYMEIVHAPNAISRFFMAHRSHRWAIVGGVVAVMVLIVVLIPSIAEWEEKHLSEEGVASPAIIFNNKDALGMSHIETVTVSSTEAVEVYLVTADVYRNYGLNDLELQNRKLNSAYLIGPEGGELQITLPNMERRELALVVMQGDEGAVAYYHLEAKVSELFFSSIPLLAALYATASFGFALWLSLKLSGYRQMALYA